MRARRAKALVRLDVWTQPSDVLYPATMVPPVRDTNAAEATSRMDVDIDGLIQLLAKSLYSKAEVFVRELLQNAHDAIEMRLASGSRIAGRIDIRVDPEERQLVFSDNGIGMDEEDIRRFLAVIGSSNKPEYRERLRKEGRAIEEGVVGQFGIGLLSAFMVANQLVIRTLKLGAKDAWEWENKGAATYTLRRCERSEPGTDVILSVRRDGEDFLDAKRVEKIARHYMGFLPYPIFVNGEGPINEVNPPWRRRWTSDEERRRVYTAFINERFPDIPLDVMPVEIDEPTIRGVLYISSERVQLDAAGVVDLYVRRVLVLGRDSTILPRWARFVSGVIDCPSVKLVASRENILREDETFLDLQRKLGEIVLKRMRWLAQEEPRRFEKITTFHSFSLLTMALMVEEFFEATKHLLLLPTNRGPMNLHDYLACSKPEARLGDRVPIYYVATEGADRQFFSIGTQKGWVVINAGGYLVEPFLKRYAEVEASRVALVPLEQHDLFDKPAPNLAGAAVALERDIDVALREAGIPDVRVRSRSFEPASIPGLVALAPKTEAQKQLEAMENMRSLLTGFREVTDAARDGRSSSIDMAINLSNPVVADLLRADRKDPALFDVMVSLYSCALLGSRGLLNDQTVPLVSAHFQRLLGATLKSREEIQGLREELRALKAQIEVARPPARDSRPALRGLTVFMCTPYDDRYKAVEQALRSVLERPPYCFRVRLATDFAHAPMVHSSVVEHIRQADAFVADVSEVNPNVMFELGAAVFTQRPIFLLRSSDAPHELPIDLGNRLWIEYPAESRDVDAITAAIRVGLERNGRPAHASLEELLGRRQVHYLSEALFKALQVQIASSLVVAILKKYETVEELLAADAEVLMSQTGIRRYLVEAVREELRELLGGRAED